MLQDGHRMVPVSDGTYYTEDNMGEGFETAVFIMAFYDSSNNIVTPTGGTVRVEMKPIAGQWAGPSDGQHTIQANTIDAVATYEIPYFKGPAYQGRIVLSGITGTAAYAEAYFWRGMSA